MFEVMHCIRIMPGRKILDLPNRPDIWVKRDYVRIHTHKYASR